MVVNLAVYCKNVLVVGAEERLLARFWVDDRQTLVCKDCRLSAVYAAPVGSSVSNFLRHPQSLLPKVGCLLLYVEYAYYATHDIVFY